MAEVQWEAGDFQEPPSPYRDVIVTAISDSRDKLQRVSQDIWTTPEMSFSEVRAHDNITSYLSGAGFQVERGYVLPTGFKAEFSSSHEPDSPDSNSVAFICEYDALPDIGHAAGHNLTSASSIAAALALKTCMEKGLIKGKITIFGTPCEDGGGGKIDMVEAGAFTDLDFAMMVSPLHMHIACPVLYTMAFVSVTYRGKTVHASAYPWEGRNALDAAVSCYNNISLLRQQMKPTWAINGIITKGGAQANMIPETSELQFWLRAPEITELVFLQQKCTACFVAAAKATSCEVEFEFENKIYESMHHNNSLSERYITNGQSLGFNFQAEEPTGETHIGSSDFGNVSRVVPSIKPTFSIGSVVRRNTVAFTEAAGSDTAHDQALAAGVCLALTAADVMTNPALMLQVKEEFARNEGSSSNLLLRQVGH